MKRYILKIDESTYVKSINWIIITLPVIKSGNFDDALIFEENYLNEAIGHSGYEQTVTRKDLIISHYPTVKFIKVKIVIDE